MNADLLLQHYDKISDAPDAVERLRLFILDLAVRGKLVEHLPDDECASDQIPNIVKKKEELRIEGKFKSIDRTELPRTRFPYSVPKSWTWCLLDDITAVARGGSPRPIKSFLTENENGIPWIKIGDAERGSRYIEKARERIVESGISRSRMVYAGDLLLSNSMSFGFPYISKIKGCIHDGWLVLRTPEELVEKLYLHLLLRSNHAKGFFSEAASGAVVQNLNADKVRLLPVPLPPLAEQHRIVAKVDELMGLCDQLEEARKIREATRDKLTTASLARLTDPDSTDEEFRDNARFTLDALPSITCRKDQIRAIRKTVSGLAVRGKLVTQQTDDEPATQLVSRINEWRLKAISERLIRPPRKKLGPISNEDRPYVLPQGWVFARLGNLLTVQSGDGLTAKNMKDGPYPVFGGNGVNGYHEKANVEEPTIVIGRVGFHCGSIHETPSKAWVTDNAFVVKYDTSSIHQGFLKLLLSATNLKENESATAQPVISGSKIYPIVLGLPPFAEQRRIVAKVDELMGICDQLEASLSAAEATRAKLLEATLRKALEPVQDALEAAE